MKMKVVVSFLIVALQPAAVFAEDYSYRKNAQGTVVGITIQGAQLAGMDLKNFPDIVSICVYSHHVTADEMKHICKAKNVRKLVLGDAPEGIEIATETLNMIRTFDQLESVTICKINLSDDDLKVFSELKHLTSISIFGSNLIASDTPSKHGLTDGASQVLKNIPQLKWLDIYGEAELTDIFVRNLAVLKNISHIGLQSNNFTDITLSSISEMISIKQIYLSSDKFSKDKIDVMKLKDFQFVKINDKIIVNKFREIEK